MKRRGAPPEYFRALRDKRKSDGLCVRCGGAKEPGTLTVMCAACKVIKAEFQLRRRSVNRDQDKKWNNSDKGRAAVKRYQDRKRAEKASVVAPVKSQNPRAFERWVEAIVAQAHSDEE